MRIIFPVLLMLFAPCFYSQTVVSELPIRFGQFFNNPQINPAKGGSKMGIELYAGSRRNSGSFAGVSTSLFSCYFRLNSKNKSFNVLGVDFNNDKEGPFLSRNRFYGSFSRHQKLNDSWFFAGGVSLGMYNFGIKSSDVIPGVSAAAFDGNGGIWLYTKNTGLGISVNQFNNAKVQPVDEVIQLTRHYHFMAEHTLAINELFQIKPSVFTRIMENNTNRFLRQWGLGGAVNFLIKDIVGFGTSYEKDEGFYACIGIQNVCVACQENKNSALSIDLSYFMPSRTNYRTNTQCYELVLRYYFDKNKNSNKTSGKNENAAKCPEFKK